jgi:hypothetical protein
MEKYIKNKMLISVHARRSQWFVPINLSCAFSGLYFCKGIFYFLVPAWGVFWGGRSSQFDRFCAKARQSSCREMLP